MTNDDLAQHFWPFSYCLLRVHSFWQFCRLFVYCVIRTLTHTRACERNRLSNTLQLVLKDTSRRKKKTLPYIIVYIMFIHILCSRVGTRYIILRAVLLTYFRSYTYWLADNLPPTLSKIRVSNIYKHYKISVCVVHTHTYKLVYYIIYIFLVYAILPLVVFNPFRKCVGTWKHHWFLYRSLRHSGKAFSPAGTIFTCVELLI